MVFDHKRGGGQKVLFISESVENVRRHWKIYHNHYKTNLKQFPVTCHAHDTIPN